MLDSIFELCLTFPIEDILSQMYDVIQSDVVLHLQVHLEKSLKILNFLIDSIIIKLFKKNIKI